MNGIVLVCIACAYSAFIILVLRILPIKLPLTQKALIIAAIATPFGRLLYFPEFAVGGLKAAFLLCAFSVCIFIVDLALTKKMIPHDVRLQLLCVLPITLSLIGVQPRINLVWDQLYESQKDSVVFRIIAYLICVLYGCAVAICIRGRHGEKFKKSLIESFILSMVAACAIGVLIFAGVWARTLTVKDLDPISVDTHIVDNFYRFNPGGNVNEFGVLAGYAILLVLYRALGRAMRRTDVFLIGLFGAALFASLTRGAWLAFGVAMVLYSCYSMKRMKRLAGIGIGFTLLMVVLSFANENLRMIIDTRFSFDMGPSGEERLEKFRWAFDALMNDSYVQLLFGHGWATNLYAHSIFFQLLYEVGILGFGIILFLLTLPIFICIKKALAGSAQSLESQLLSMMGAFLLIVATVHHTMYHVQTWMIFGLILAGSSVKTVTQLNNSRVGLEVLPASSA